jgi:hypothetical protein
MTGKVVLTIDSFGNEVYIPVIMVDAELEMEIDAELDAEFDAEEAVLPSA